MGRNALQNINNLLKLATAVFSHHLEWAEDFGGQKLLFLRSTEMLEGNEDCCRLPRSVLGGDRVVLQGVTTKQDFGSIKLEDGILMRLDALVGPAKDRADS